MREDYKQQVTKQNYVQWFLAVDLAEQVFLADGQAPGSVGGKESASREQIDQHAQTGNLRQMHEALNTAFTSRRSIRHPNQWIVAWWRYVSAAIAADHITWSVALGHFAYMMKLFEKACMNGTSFYVVLLYDILLRGEW